MLRCLWFANRPGVSFHRLPLELNRARLPESCEFAAGDLEGMADRMAFIQLLLSDYFEGRSSRLLDWLERLLEAREISPFQRSLHEADLETLFVFYRYGPRRNWKFRNEFALERSIIGKEMLDDLIVRESSQQGEAPEGLDR